MPRKPKYLSFKEARSYVQILRIRNLKEWESFCKKEKPKNIPADPKIVYKAKGWRGWKNWLKLPIGFKIKWRNFNKAREYVRKLNLKRYEEWTQYSKGGLPKKGLRPIDIPSDPFQKYKNAGWKSYGDWLGTGNIAFQDRVFRPYNRARAFVRSLGISKSLEWNKYCVGKIPRLGKKPHDIPSNPIQVYQNKGWKGMRDWLGTEGKNHQWRSYKNARTFVRNLSLKGSKKWQ